MSEKNSITLPSGAKVVLKDPKTLRVKDRRKVFAHANNDAGLMQALSIVDGLIALLVAEWTFEFPIPSIKINVLDELEIPDYDMLAEHAREAQKVLFPQVGQTDASEADADSPFGKSSDQDGFLKVVSATKRSPILMKNFNTISLPKDLVGRYKNMMNRQPIQWITCWLFLTLQKEQGVKNLITSNLKLVRAVWTKKEATLNVAARAARDEMMVALIQLSKEQIARRRVETKKGEWTPKPIPGESAWSRSGELRRHITGMKFTAGFGNYTAVVGPTIVYARKVELGGDNWKPGVRYPYMEPAYEKFRTTIVPQVQTKFFRRFAR